MMRPGTKQLYVPPTPVIVAPASLLPQTADKFPPNPSIPWQKWNARPSDAFLIQHYTNTNVQDWFKNTLNELRIDQLLPVVEYYRTGVVPKNTRSVEVLDKYKPTILAHAAGRGVAVPVESSVAVATTATPPVSTTKVEEVGKGSAAITTIEDFKAKNPIQQAATAPAEGMSMNMKLGIAAVVAVGGFYLWKRRSA